MAIKRFLSNDLQEKSGMLIVQLLFKYSLKIVFIHVLFHQLIVFIEMEIFLEIVFEEDVSQLIYKQNLWELQF